MAVEVADILKKLSKDGLKRVARLRRQAFKGKTRDTLIEHLKTLKWRDDHIQQLADILRRDMDQRARLVSRSIYRADGLSPLEPEDIRDRLDENRVDFDSENAEKFSGFQILSTDRNSIQGKYWYLSERLVVGERDIYKFSMANSVEFEVSLPRLVFVQTTNPGRVLLCKRALEEALSIEMIPANEVVSIA